MAHTVAENIEVIPVLIPAVRTAAATSQAVDMARKRGAAVAVILGAHDRTTGDETLTVTVEESDDGNSWSAVPNASVVIGNVVPDANTGTNFLIALKEHKRYLRVKGTPAGTTPSDAYGVVILAETVYVKPSPQAQSVTHA